MRSQTEIDDILRNVQQKLDKKKISTGFALYVPPGGYVQDDDWLSVVVEPDAAGMRAYEYVELLGEVDDELRADGVDKVIIVPAIGD